MIPVKIRSDPAVDGVVHKTIKELPAKRLAEGLVPPTNRWFSGLVFGDKPQPVFPLPLSLRSDRLRLRLRPADGHRRPRRTSAAASGRT